MPPKEQRGIHDHAKKLSQAGTFGERIQAIGFQSGTWDCKEDAKFGLEKLSAAHSKQGYARCKQMFAGTEVDMELDAAARGAAANKKRKLDSEVDGFLAEAESARSSQAASAFAIPAKGKAKPASRPSALSQLVVKKKATDDASAGSAPEPPEGARAAAKAVGDTGELEPSAAPAASAAAPAPAGGLGLGAYGSSSSSEDEE